MAPLFTIAITTYNRNDMLKECLNSIFQQDFSDYEVIIGNNYTEEILTKEALNVKDARVRIINRPKNLGQLGNMNSLLAEAKGRYFSWMADDDMLAPQCLKLINNALENFSYPKCVFSLYSDGLKYNIEPVNNVQLDSFQVMEGREFLQGYLSRKLKLIGCYGGFETDYLRKLGGIRVLGNSFSPYADNILAIEAGVLDKVVYVNIPLFFFRTHDESLSYTSNDLSAYTSAQQDLLSKCKKIFKHDNICDDQKLNMSHLLKWCSGDIYEVLYKGSSFMPLLFLKHLKVLDSYARKGGFRFYANFLLLNFWLLCKYVIRRLRKKLV